MSKTIPLTALMLMVYTREVLAQDIKEMLTYFFPRSEFELIVWFIVLFVIALVIYNGGMKYIVMLAILVALVLAYLYYFG